MIKITIYVLIDPRGKEVRYVGGTHKTLKERLRAHMASIRHRANVAPRFEWLRELAAAGLEPWIESVAETTEDGWTEAESRWIQHYRDQGCVLLNVKAGGLGPRANAVRQPWTPEQRRAQSVQTQYRYAEDPTLRNRVSAGTRAAMADYMANHGAEHAAKVSAGLRRRYADPAARELTGQRSAEMWGRPGFKDAARKRAREAVAREARVSCPVCGMVSRPANIAKHRKARGH